MALIAHFLGDSPAGATLRLDTRIVHDLGIYGHDAFEFFDDFTSRFDVDLEPLHTNWQTHIPPEGPNLRSALPLMLVLVPLPFVLIPLGINPVWGWAVELVGLLVWRFAFNEWPGTARAYEPIYVADLIASAKAKRWITATEVKGARK